MRLYHATPKRNIESIQANGLDPNRSLGAKNEVWLHTASRREWAILHVSNKHECDVNDVSVITVDVPRSALRRRWRGIWTTAETLTDFQGITNASAFSKSPVA